MLCIAVSPIAPEAPRKCPFGWPVGAFAPNLRHWLPSHLFNDSQEKHMASIRYRAPWRVTVNGEDDPKGPFATNKQAEAHKEALKAQGIDEKSIMVIQARKGTWEVRVRRLGSLSAHRVSEVGSRCAHGQRFATLPHCGLPRFRVATRPQAGLRCQRVGIDLSCAQRRSPRVGRSAADQSSICARGQASEIGRRRRAQPHPGSHAPHPWLRRNGAARRPGQR